MYSPKIQKASKHNAHHSSNRIPMEGQIYGKGLLQNQQDKPELQGLFLEGDIKILKIVELSSEGMCCKFSQNGEKLAVGLANGNIKIFNSAKGVLMYHLSDEDTCSDRLPVTSIHFLPAELSPSGELLIATYASGMIKFWHISTSAVLKTINEPRQTLSASLSPSGKHFVTGGSTEQMNIYDIETREKVQTCETSIDRLVMDGHRFRVFALKHHPTMENIFLSGGWDDTIQIWDMRADHATRRIYGPHICGEGIDIDKKYNHILTSSWRKNNVLQVWDFDSGKCMKTIPADFSGDSSLYCGQWLGKEHVVCGGSGLNMIRIVDKTSLVTSGIISNLPSGVYSIDHDRERLGNNDVTLIAATAGNQLYFILNFIKKE